MVNEAKDSLGFYDDSYKLQRVFIKSKIRNGWNFIAIQVDNDAKEIEVFINTSSIDKIKKTKLSRNLVYIGNNNTGTEPFGIIADVRVYSYKVSI